MKKSVLTALHLSIEDSLGVISFPELERWLMARKRHLRMRNKEVLDKSDLNYINVEGHSFTTDEDLKEEEEEDELGIYDPLALDGNEEGDPPKSGGSSKATVHKWGKCSKTFRDSSELEVHEKTHPKKRTLATNDCDKNVEVELKSHKKIKSEVKPSESREKINSKSELKPQQLATETETEPKSFDCHECAKTFSQRRDLNMHIKTHMGDRPYKCKLCSYGSRYKAGLSKHLKTNHAN